MFDDAVFCFRFFRGARKGRCTWAEADVAGARANVHCKEKPDLGQLKEAVRAGGYTVLSAECAEDARHAG